MLYIKTYDKAEQRAQELLGPNGAVRFFPKNPSATKYAFGQMFTNDLNGEDLFGVIGTGASWDEAYADAMTRLAEYQAAGS